MSIMLPIHNNTHVLYFPRYLEDHVLVFIPSDHVLVRRCCDKNYYIELCYNCTQTIAEVMFVGLFGQGKYDRYCIFWDGLKTIVCTMGIKPSTQLLLAYKSAENRQTFGPDIDKTIEILERQPL